MTALDTDRATPADAAAHRAANDSDVIPLEMDPVAFAARAPVRSNVFFGSAELRDSHRAEDEVWLQGPALVVMRVAVVAGWAAIAFAALRMLPF